MRAEEPGFVMGGPQPRPRTHKKTRQNALRRIWKRGDTWKPRLQEVPSRRDDEAHLILERDLRQPLSRRQLRGGGRGGRVSPAPTNVSILGPPESRESAPGPESCTAYLFAHPNRLAPRNRPD